MAIPTELQFDIDSLSYLTTRQKEQILRQIEYHLEAPPYEDVKLNDVVSLQMHICDGVTRPMSSKGLAQWLWRSPDLYIRKRVLDIGTGCGVQGITCLLGGADFVLFSDVSDESVRCTQNNLDASGLGIRGEVKLSDLFDSLGNTDSFDLIVFAQPYFQGLPLAQFAFTRGMLAPSDLLHRFFADARNFLSLGGHIVLMGWSFAGIVNDPAVVGPKYGFTEIRQGLYQDMSGIQQGEFHVLLFA